MSELAGLIAGLLPGASGDDLLEAVCHALAQATGASVLADAVDEPDVVRRVSACGPDGPLPLPVDGRVGGRRSSATQTGLLRRLLATPGGVLRLTDLPALEHDPDERVRQQVALARSLGAVEVLLLGLSARGRTLGVLTLALDAPTDGLDLAPVATLVSVALDAHRLLAAQAGTSAAVQTSLLPPLPAVAGVRLAARYVPAPVGLAVGGDWYDAFVLRSGSLGLVIGDATGHDTRSTVRMAELRHVLRALAVDHDEEPAALLTRADGVLCALSPDGPPATCVYARLSGSRLQWSSAGHLPPVLLRQGAARLLETEPDLLLGVDPSTPRAGSALELAAGDVLVLCTDGLVERRGTGLDAQLELLRATVEQGAGRPLEAQANALVDALVGPDAEDDVAVLLVELAAPVEQVEQVSPAGAVPRG